MHLYEYQSKNLFKKYNLPVLQGSVCSNIDDIKNYIIHQIHGSSIMKCQIHSGGRGKAKGIQIVHTTEEAYIFAKKWFNVPLVTEQTTTEGELVTYILIEPVVQIVQEFYLSILIDRDSSQIICMVSHHGGIDIETISQKNPNFIHKSIINPLSGAYPYQGRILASKLGFSGEKLHQFSNIITNMTNMFLENDLMLVEINPLVITNDNILLCLDAKITIDDNAIFRQSELLNMYVYDNIHTKIPEKRENINYIPLNDGNIGCMVNGAGLAMATMDLIKTFGGCPANFLDIGGATDKIHIVTAFEMLLKDKQIKAIFVNIFGGIVCCDLIADGIISALSTYNVSSHVPIIARLQGNNAQKGTHRLMSSNFHITIENNLFSAMQKIITLVQ